MSILQILLEQMLEQNTFLPIWIGNKLQMYIFYLKEGLSPSLFSTNLFFIKTGY